MDDPKRQLLLLGAFGLVAAGLYFTEIFSGSGNSTPTDAVTSEPEAVEARESDDDEGASQTLLDSARQARREVEQRFSIRTDDFTAELSNLNTGLVSVQLHDSRYQVDGKPLELVTTDREEYYSFRLSPRGVHIPPSAVWSGEQVDARTVRFRWQGDGFEVVRKVEAGSGPFQLWSTVRIRNTASTERPVAVSHVAYHYVARDDEESGGMIGRPSTAATSSTCAYGDDELERISADDLREKAPEHTAHSATPGMGFGPEVRFVSLADTYFATAMAAGEGLGQRCVLTASHRGGKVADDSWVGTLFTAELRDQRVALGAGEELTSKTLGFVGPTQRDALARAGHGLTEVVDLGWFSFIANGFTQLLELIQSKVGNWGLAIILLTILVKLVFFPLTFHSFKAMAKMRQLKPQIDALNERYAEDREKKGAAMMELYRKEGVNPAAGCLPSLLQMPVWFALYRSLSTNVELYNAPFALYWTDLSAPDPYYVLPIFVALLMHVQQRLTPTTMDSAQMKMMMYFMPLMIGAFMLFLPAGLCLYMVTNSVLTMAQQKAIYSKLDREEASKTDAATPIEDLDDDDDPDPGSLQPTEALAGATASTRRRTLKRGKKRQRRG